MDINYERLNYLLSFETSYINRLIHCILDNAINDYEHVKSIYCMIVAYIALEKMQQKKVCENVEEYFLDNLYTKKEYKIFVGFIKKNTNNQNGNEFSENQYDFKDINTLIRRYLIYFEDYIVDFIEDVLKDSRDDPEWSAVAANNLIVCYIDIGKQVGLKIPYDDVEGFFEYNQFDKENYLIFDYLQTRESTYYRGKRYM